MLTTKAISPDAYYFERIGFRAAWVSIMQVPFVVLLSSRINLLGLLVGSSYERLNWLHRFVARVMLVTVAVHAGFFLHQWIRADFLALELEMMPMVKYGMGAAGVLLWMNLSGLAPLRHNFYEFFIVQHLASIAMFLWLLHSHVPSYAMYYVWAAVGFAAIDRVWRGLLFAYRNLRIRPTGPDLSKLRLADRIGYRAELHALPGGVTRVVIQNVPFKWRPGQHVYIWMPSIGLLETHPFTISNAYECNGGASVSGREMAATVGGEVPAARACGVEQAGGPELPHAQLEIRAHSGFSRRIQRVASHRLDPEPSSTVTPAVTRRVFLFGPFGAPPQWNAFQTVLLVSASTGGSFTLPILQSLLAVPGCVRRVHFLLLVRRRPQCSCYLAQLRSLARYRSVARDADGVGVIDLRIHVAVTGRECESEHPFEGNLADRCCCASATADSAPCCCGAAKLNASETRPDASSAPASANTIASASWGPGRHGKDGNSDSTALPSSTTSSTSTPAPVDEIHCCAVPDASPQPDLPEDTPEAPPPNKLQTVLPTKMDAIGEKCQVATVETVQAMTSLPRGPGIHFSAARPQLESVIREAVEGARGETLVVCCGGRPLVAEVRNRVAALSDERAVHKGTGAQGIGLWVEEFAF